MRSVVLHCPPLGRDISALRAAVPNVLVHESTLTPNGVDGCLEGHKAIVREAQSLGVSRVFVMEDDCQFTKHFNWSAWLLDANWAQMMGYDVLCGGSTRTYDAVRVADNMIEVSAFHSAHCVVYFESGYAKMLNAVSPVDWSLGRDCGMRCVLVHPFVAVQRPSYSGIERCDVDYVPLYHHHEAELRRLL